MIPATGPMSKNKQRVREAMKDCPCDSKIKKRIDRPAPMNGKNTRRA